MTHDEWLTSDERDAMTEDELLEHDLRYVKRGRGVSENTARALVRGRIRRERAEAALRKRAEDAGVTVDARRRAEAEQRAAERERRARRDLAAARDAVARETAAEPPPRRKRGRSRWTAELFDARMHEAQGRTERPWSDDRLAPHFRGLAADGTIGIDPETLRKLRRRREENELPPG